MSRAGPRDWLILETAGRGHRAWFLRLLIDESARRIPVRTATIVTTADAVATDAWSLELDELRHTFGLVISRRPLLKVTGRLLRSREHLVVPDGDGQLPGLCVLSLVMRRRLVGSVLILRPCSDRSTTSRIAAIVKRSLRRMLARSSPGLRIFDLVAAPPGDHGRDVVLDPIAFAPATDPRESWLERQGLAGSARVALVIGDISERKCVAELVSAARQSHLPGLVLVAVGRPRPEIRSVFTDADGHSDQRVHLFEGFVSDADFDTWIAIADAVCVVHRNEGSSGVLLKAWAAGTPVLVGGASVIDAARTLGMARIETRSLLSETLARKLEDALSTERAPLPATHWESRKAQFTSAMLGP